MYCYIKKEKSDFIILQNILNFQLEDFLTELEPLFETRFQSKQRRPECTLGAPSISAGTSFPMTFKGVINNMRLY